MARIHGRFLKMKVALQRDPENLKQQLASDAPDDEDTTCSICMESYTIGEQLRVLPCEHRFHCGCVEEWLRHHYKCPLCRASPAAAACS